MRRCIVLGCGNSQGKKASLRGITFHRIPYNENRRIAWLKAIGPLRCPSISKQSLVCSVHFTSDCFDKTAVSGLVRLREWAIPSLSLSDLSRFDPLTPSCSETESYTTANGHDFVEITFVDVNSETDSPITASIHDITETEFVHTATQPGSTANSSMSISNTTVGTQTLETSYMILTSRKRLTEKYDKLLASYKTLQKKCRTLNRRNLRREKQIAYMKTVIKELSKSKLMCEETLQTLSEFPVAKELFLRKAGSYSPAIRKFATVLHFYSPKAYRFVRSEFSPCLPHPKVIMQWYKSVNDVPSFTTESDKATANTNQSSHDE